jgi:hypothetical protein
VSDDSRKSALLKALEERGITTQEQLLEAIRKMKKLDITQFVFTTSVGGEANAR